MLAIDGLSKTYRNSDAPALHGVSFSVRPGGFSALLGPNGAGKSTLINILAGRVDPGAGTIRIAGEELRPGRPGLRALIGIVPQEIRFDFVFTVEELLRLEQGFYGLARDEAHIQYLLERLTLADKRRVKTRALSGGMLRRLMIARALVHRPRLLLLDEPTAGVDLHLRRDMYAFLRELNASGTTIVLTTHYLEEAEELCDHVIVVDQGRVVADEPRDAFLRLAGDFLTVTITTSAADALRPFFEAGGGTSLPHTDEGLRFVFPGAQREVLLSRLSEAAPHIDSFEILKPKLEEVFVRLTNKEARSHAQLN
jgi:ABC-2 type transport system ATP-binding protein